KDRVSIYPRSFLLDILNKGVADVLREWQPNLAARLATQADRSGRPVEIVQFETGDISGAKPQTGQQEQNGPVAAATPGQLIARCYHPLDIGSDKVPRQRRKAPLQDWWHRMI